MTDKQLGLLNWFWHIVKGKDATPATASEAARGGRYAWTDPWTLSAPQTSLGGVRYQLAFTAYAASLLGAAHTPAYPGYTSLILREAFGRLVDPVAWSYWDEPGHCGFPLAEHCRTHNKSMCELNLKYGDKACPDPVIWENVMYSAHLAQVGALYESVSGDASLTEAGWQFSGERTVARGVGPLNYTLPKLFESLLVQARRSSTGGIACEPSFVYLVCNQHMYAASRLYDRLHDTRGRYSSEAARWYDYISQTAVRKHQVGLMGEGHFTLFYQEQAKAVLGVDWIDFDVGGCAANDGWALSWIAPWATRLPEPRGADSRVFLDRGRLALATSLDWRKDNASGGRFLAEAKMYQTERYTAALATSFAPAALGGFRGDSAGRVRDAFTYMERHFGSALDTDGDGVADAYMYDTDADNASVRMWATANLAIATSMDDELLASVYDGDLFARALARPHLDSMLPPPPVTLVRRAIFDDAASSLSITLTATARASSPRLVVRVPSGYVPRNASASSGERWVCVGSASHSERGVSAAGAAALLLNFSLARVDVADTTFTMDFELALSPTDKQSDAPPRRSFSCGMTQSARP